MLDTAHNDAAHEHCINLMQTLKREIIADETGSLSQKEAKLNGDPTGSALWFFKKDHTSFGLGLHVVNRVHALHKLHECTNMSALPFLAQRGVRNTLLVSINKQDHRILI